MLLHSAIGILLFAYALRRRSHFWCRFLGMTSLCLVVNRLISMVFFDPLFIKGDNGLGRAAVSLLCYLFVFLIVLACFNESSLTAMFISSAAYIAQDIGGSFKSIILLIPVFRSLSGTPAGMIAIDMLLFPPLFLVLFWRFRPFTRDPNESFEDRRRIFFSTGALLFCIIAARLTDGNTLRNALSIYVEESYQIICDLLLLLLQFGVMERSRLETSVDGIRKLMQEQHEQYDRSKRSAELVNEKYHDLKGLLDRLNGEIPKEQIDRLRSMICEYDTYVDTGNQVFDIVLAEQKAACDQNGIIFTCYVDGSDMDFVEELDLYALANNALNNAVEAARQLPAGERFISLSARCVDGMLMLHMENPFCGTLEMEHGLPKSDRDRCYHGFGMKSMKRIAEKYDGALSVQCEDQVFILDILLLRP